MKIVIADSSTLIVLLDTDNFSILFELFEGLIITKEVYDEVVYNNAHKDSIDKFVSLGKITIYSIEHGYMFDMLRKRLDIGESSSIELAKKMELPLIIDEKKGRKVALSLGIDIIGFVGIILKLLQKKSITKTKALEIIEDAEKNYFRLSKELKNMIKDY